MQRAMQVFISGLQLYCTLEIIYFFSLDLNATASQFLPTSARDSPTDWRGA